MENKLWDKKFVYFMWDDALEGKEVFASDRISELKYDVEHDYLKDTVEYSGDEDFPFLSTGEKLKFCYYDPLYEYKRAYYVEGRTLLFREHPDRDAIPIQGEPTWQGDWE